MQEMVQYTTNKETVLMEQHAITPPPEAETL